ncbi:hypothetical protein HDU93_001654 [Gonapodya sp. JEL0774]|nr:hypothetical protein HDU93_001654 [Gonapodya sp. JEL0774]
MSRRSLPPDPLPVTDEDELSRGDRDALRGPTNSIGPPSSARGAWGQLDENTTQSQLGRAGIAEITEILRDGQNTGVEAAAGRYSPSLPGDVGVSSPVAPHPPSQSRPTSAGALLRGRKVPQPHAKTGMESREVTGRSISGGVQLAVVPKEGTGSSAETQLKAGKASARSSAWVVDEPGGRMGGDGGGAEHSEMKEGENDPSDEPDAGAGLMQAQRDHGSVGRLPQWRGPNFGSTDHPKRDVQEGVESAASYIPPSIHPGNLSSEPLVSESIIPTAPIPKTSGPYPPSNSTFTALSMEPIRAKPVVLDPLPRAIKSSMKLPVLNESETVRESVSTPGGGDPRDPVDVKRALPLLRDSPGKESTDTSPVSVDLKFGSGSIQALLIPSLKPTQRMIAPVFGSSQPQIVEQAESSVADKDRYSESQLSQPVDNPVGGLHLGEQPKQPPVVPGHRQLFKGEEEGQISRFQVEAEISSLAEFAQAKTTISSISNIGPAPSFPSPVRSHPELFPVSASTPTPSAPLQSPILESISPNPSDPTPSLARLCAALARLPLVWLEGDMSDDNVWRSVEKEVAEAERAVADSGQRMPPYFSVLLSFMFALLPPHPGGAVYSSLGRPNSASAVEVVLALATTDKRELARLTEFLATEVPEPTNSDLPAAKRKLACLPVSESAAINPSQFFSDSQTRTAAWCAAFAWIKTTAEVGVAAVAAPELVEEAANAARRVTRGMELLEPYLMMYSPPPSIARTLYPHLALLSRLACLVPKQNGDLTAVIGSWAPALIKIGRAEMATIGANEGNPKPPWVVDVGEGRTGVMELIRAKQSREEEERAQLAREMGGAQSSAAPLTSSSPLPPPPHLPPHPFDPTPPAEIFAVLERVFMQVDPITERLAPATTVAGATPSAAVQSTGGAEMEEVLVSTAWGALVVTRDEIVWYGRERKDAGGDSSGTGRLREALRQKFSTVLRFSTGPCHRAPHPTRATPGRPLPNTNTASSARHHSTQKPIWHHLALFTRREVFRFYPFSADEKDKLIGIIGGLIGCGPVGEKEYVKGILSKKLETLRRQVLHRILTSSVTQPWIDTSADLVRVMKDLTSENRPQSIFEMERLFHSCRLEPEVTKETIYNLRRIWHNTRSEQVRIKALSIADRILDKVVMRSGDPNFSTMYKWLKHLEETVNPYKSPQSLLIIETLIRRAKYIQIEPLTPLANNAYPAMFDHWEDYCYMVQHAGLVGEF